MNKRSAPKASFGTKAKEAAVRGRSIQTNVDRLEANKKRSKSDEVMQAASGNIHPSFRRSISLSPGGRPI